MTNISVGYLFIFRCATYLVFITLFYSCAWATNSCSELFQKISNDRDTVSAIQESFVKFNLSNQKFIHESEFMDLKYAPMEAGFKGLLVATYNGHAVLLKIAGEKEMFFAQLISDLMIGPRFYGITKLTGQEQYHFLVMEYLGTGDLYRRTGRENSLLPPNMALDRFPILQNWLIEAVDHLSARGIKVHDLQVFVGNDGRMHIIDTGYYNLEMNIRTAADVSSIVAYNRINYVYPTLARIEEIVEFHSREK